MTNYIPTNIQDKSIEFDKMDVAMGATSQAIEILHGLVSDAKGEERTRINEELQKWYDHADHLVRYNDAIPFSSDLVNDTNRENDMSALTTENLDRVAKALQDDLKPKPDYHEAWCERLNMIMCQLINHFEDGNDVIIQAKLGDQLPRMFEKMRDNVTNQAQKLKRERASAIRNDVGIEITQNTIDDLDEKIERLRVQWWTLNESFKTARDKTRSHATSTSGISFGSYQTLAELPRMRRVKMRKNQLTMETYMANQHHFWDFARDTGLVEKPSDYDYGSKDFTLE